MGGIVIYSHWLTIFLQPGIGLAAVSRHVLIFKTVRRSGSTAVLAATH
jgi:hypothetical protein